MRIVQLVMLGVVTLVLVQACSAHPPRARDRSCPAIFGSRSPEEP